MILLLLAIAIVGASCSGLRPTDLKPKSEADIRSGITVLLAKQRANRAWMERGDCPADAASTSGRTPSVEEATCASNPEDCLAKCETGDGANCYALALAIQTHDGLESDVADVLFRKSCKLGIASGCTNAASPLADKQDPDSLACAARTFEATCKNADPWGCSMDGMMKMDGIGRQQDHDGARRSFDRACELSTTMKFQQPCERAKELKALMEKESGKEDK